MMQRLTHCCCTRGLQILRNGIRALSFQRAHQSRAIVTQPGNMMLVPESLRKMFQVFIKPLRCTHCIEIASLDARCFSRIIERLRE